MTLYYFWAEHADAVGAAIIVTVLACVALARIIRHYERLARGQRATFRARLAAARQRARLRYRQLLDARPGGFDDHATRALRQARPVRTPLTDSYALEPTVAEATAYLPVFTPGRAR